MDGPWRRVPLARGTVSEHLLEMSDDLTCRAFSQRRHGAAIREGGPGEWTDNAVDHEPSAFLEVFDCALRLGSEHAVNRNTEVGRASQGTLKSPDRFTRRPKADCWLTRIRHSRLLSMRVSTRMSSADRRQRKDVVGCYRGVRVALMRYKPKSIAALHIALGGLPDKMRVEVDRSIGISAKTVGELRKVTAWPENLVITTPQASEGVVTVSKASVATRVSPKP
jgi:hypothetical protein